METKAKTVTAGLFALVTALAAIYPALPHWVAVVPAIAGVIGVYAVPNAHQPSSFLTTMPGTLVKIDHTGVSMTEPTTPVTDPYAGARAMGVAGVPPLPEKPKEDSPEIAALKAEIARLSGNPAEPVPAPSVAERAAGTLSNPFSAPAVSVTPAAAAPAAGVAPDNFINNVASRMRTALSDLTQIVEDLEANGVKF